MRTPPERISASDAAALPLRARRHRARGSGVVMVAVPVVVGVIAACPAARSARAEVAVDPWPRTAVATEALSGGVLRLRAPATGMIRVPRSTFSMGSDGLAVIEAAASCRRASPALPRAARGSDGEACSEEVFAVELERHRVTLSAYWLDRSEVTVAAYNRCVQLGRCAARPIRPGGERFERPELPASLVRWEDAEAYCRFRGARLPTEAEFERAARGTSGRRFPWGDTFHRGAANHGRLGWDRTASVDGYAELAPVGSYPSGRTPEGFLDLAGNAAEWVADRFQAPYPAGDAIDPVGPPTPFAPGATPLRVARGGSYELPAPFLRGAARLPRDGSSPDPTVGFRCARSARAPEATR
jgi:sulfatase modifying factor 1